jgi:hypothetical protein
MQPLYENNGSGLKSVDPSHQPRLWGPGVGICVAEIFPSHNFGKTYR